MREYSKILFININFRYDNSSGITVSKLVDHIPREKLFLLSTNTVNSNIDIFCDKKQIGRASSVKKERKPKRSFLRKCFVSIVGQKTIFNHFDLTNDIKIWLDEIKPDYIYFCPSDLAIIEFVNEIVKFVKVKTIIHVMDDKVNVKYPGILGIIYKLKFIQSFKNIVKQSSIRLSISDLMAEEYFKRYKKVFHSFHNPVNIEKWLPYQKKEIKNKKDIKVIYSGWIESTSTPIFEFCEVIYRLNQLGYEISFILYSMFSSSDIREKIDSYSFVRINDFVSQEELPKTLSKADFLFLPLSFKKNLKFIYLSMPTKTAEYMVSGVPVIVYAPAGTALSQYSNKGEWGHTIITNKKSDVEKSVIELLNDIELQKKYSTNAMRLAKKRHDVNHNKEMFIEIIDEL